MLETNKFDAASYINSREDVIAYLNAVLDEGDPSALPEALGTIARSQGMTAISRQTGLKREGLYRSLATGGNPSFATVVKVLEALGMRLSITAS